MDEIRLKIVVPETPDKATLELLALTLNRETAHRSGENFYFEVNPEQDGLSVHVYVQEQYCLLNAVVTLVDDQIELRMPSGTVIILKRDVLDRTSPLWNN